MGLDSIVSGDSLDGDSLDCDSLDGDSAGDSNSRTVANTPSELTAEQALNLAQQLSTNHTIGVQLYTDFSLKTKELDLLIEYVKTRPLEDILFVLKQSNGDPNLLRAALTNKNFINSPQKLETDIIASALMMDAELIEDIICFAKKSELSSSQIEVLVNHLDNWRTKLKEPYLNNTDERAVYLICSGIQISEDNATSLINGIGSALALWFARPEIFRRRNNDGLRASLSNNLQISPEDIKTVAMYIDGGVEALARQNLFLKKIIKIQSQKTKDLTEIQDTDGDTVKLALIMALFPESVLNNKILAEEISSSFLLEEQVTNQDFRPSFLFSELAKYHELKRSEAIDLED